MRPRLEVGRADHRDEAEEHEDEDLAEARVPVGPGTGRIEPTGREAGGAHDQQPRRRGEGEHEAGDARDAEGAERRRLHAPRGRDAGCHEPDRPESLGVGPPDSVRVVVRVVRADLDPERDDERAERPPPDHRAIGGRHRGPDDDRHHCGRERARPGAGHPVTNRGHLAMRRVGRGSGAPWEP